MRGRRLTLVERYGHIRTSGGGDRVENAKDARRAQQLTPDRRGVCDAGPGRAAVGDIERAPFN